MNETFYKRCKKIVKELALSYEQGIARDVILNELDNLEKQATDYQKRFAKAIKILKEAGSYEEDTKMFCDDIYDELPDILNTLEGSDKE